MMRASRVPRLALAHALEGALLQHAQQLDLQLQGQVAHLVEEERAARGQLEAPLAVAHRAGEGAAHVAEQLALEQLARQRAAVDGHERPAAPRGARVDGAGHHLLAGAALAGQQHGGLAVLEVLDQPEDPLQPGRAPDEAGEGRAGLGPVLLGRAQDHDVGHARVAHGAGLRAERRGGHRQRARRAARHREERAPALAPLAGEQELAQRARRAEQLGAEEIRERAGPRPGAPRRRPGDGRAARRRAGRGRRRPRRRRRGPATRRPS